jgi:hypothetical protein
MIIPPHIKRRAVQIDDYITQRLIDHPYYLVSQHVEGYLNRMTRDLSEWFIQTYDFSYGYPTDYYKRVTEVIPFIKYLIRTKVVSHWETMNNKVVHLEIK